MQAAYYKMKRKSCGSLEKTSSIQGEADEAAAEPHEAEEKAKKLWLPLVNPNSQYKGVGPLY
jgi:hypothetical protein